MRGGQSSQLPNPAKTSKRPQAQYLGQ